MTQTPDVDHDPRKVARDSRKDRIAKNEKKHLQNVARANGSSNAAAFKTHPRDERKNDIERTLVTARISTASMGKFDKKLEGEKKLRGVKRKVCWFSWSYSPTDHFQFDPTEASAHDEKQASLALIQRMDSDAKKMRSEPRKEESLLNVRKAVRFASKGRGGLALGREVASGKSRRGGKSGRGKR